MQLQLEAASTDLDALTSQTKVWYFGYSGYCGVLAGGSRRPNGGTRTG